VPYLSELSWAQLESGEFEPSRRVVDAPPLKLSFQKFNLGFKAEARLLPNTTVVGVVADPSTRAHWFGSQLGAGGIATTRSSIELNTIGSASFYSVGVDEEQIARRFPAAPDALALLENFQNRSLAKDPIYAKRLRACMNRAFTENPPPAILSGTLIPLLGAALERRDACVVVPSECMNRRVTAVRVCEAYMREHIDATLTLFDLSAVARMRSRSLINAFEAVTGFSPMQYLKRLRLSGVNRALRRADKRRTRIIDVAADWGFWHMGHFTNDYRAMFGQTPSQTLLRA